MKTIYKGFEIITTAEYNKRQEQKYNKRVEEWKKEQKQGINNIIPQVSFFYFWDSKGNLETKGFVGIKENWEIIGETLLGLKRKITKKLIKVV